MKKKTLTLIFGNAENTLHITLIQKNIILLTQEVTIQSNGTEILVPLILDTFQKTHSNFTQLQQIGCISGPGSFTGLRIIVTTAAALRRALAIPVASLNYLHILATTLALQHPELKGTSVRIIIPARQDYLYLQDFLIDSSPKPLTEPSMKSLEEACLTKSRILFAGSGVQKHLEFFTDKSLSNPSIKLITEPLKLTAQALMELSLHNPCTNWEHHDPIPIYLNTCDAVKNIATIAHKLNYDPKQATTTLQALLTKLPAPNA